MTLGPLADSQKIKSNQEAHIDTKKKIWSDLELHDKAIIWLTFGILLIAGVTGGILVRQANIMESQLDEMRGSGQQTDSMIILNTGQLTNAARSAKAAQDQAEAAQASVKAIQRQMRQDQRAWINIEFGKLLSHDNPTTRASIPTETVTVSNTGKSPAKNIVVKIVMEKVPNGKPPSFAFPIPYVVTMGSMWQGRVQPLVDVTLRRINPQTKEAETRVLTAAEDAELIHGKAYFATYARITYDDVFGKHHWTTICAFASESDTPVFLVGANKCTDYAGVDNN